MKLAKEIFQRALNNRMRLEAKYPNLRRRVTTRQAQIGDTVYIKNPHKKGSALIYNKFEGFYKVVRVGKNKAMTVQDGKGKAQRALKLQTAAKIMKR